MKIHEVPRADTLRHRTFGEETHWRTIFTPENLHLMKYFVDAPLIEACRDLYSKNIRTWYSHCNTAGERVEFFKATLGIDAASLSEGNFETLQKLMHDRPENVHPSAWHSIESLGGSRANVIIEHRFPGDVEMDAVSQTFAGYTKKFVPQEKISDNGHFKKGKLRNKDAHEKLS